MAGDRSQLVPARLGRLRLSLFAVSGVVFGLWLMAGVLDNLVWMPQLIAPAYTLQQIYAALTRAGSAPGVAVVPVLWFLLWAVAGLAFVVVFLPAHHAFARASAATPRLGVVGIGTALFGAMAFFEWFSGFGMGMEVSDEISPYAGNTTWFGLLSFTGGALLAVTGGVLWLIGIARTARPQTPLPASTTGVPPAST